MLSIIQATHEHQPVVRALFWEYLQWANSMVNHEFHVNFDIAAMLDHDMDELQVFMPPTGRLLLAVDDTTVAGCLCMRTIGPRIAELKRMYVRPEQRGKGVGRALVNAVIGDIRTNDYTVLRLDSARFMKEAHALYRSMGFQEIAPYPESEIPEDFRENWVFMELPLTDHPVSAQ